LIPCQTRLAEGKKIVWTHSRRSLPVSISERKKEIKRRRHRRKKLTVLARKLAKATVSEKAVIADKIRHLTPGGRTVVETWGLTKR
jgi:hypothetical protein